MMQAEITGLAGPKGRYNPDRDAVRHGSAPSSVTLVWTPANPSSLTVSPVYVGLPWMRMAVSAPASRNGPNGRTDLRLPRPVTSSPTPARAAP